MLIFIFFMSTAGSYELEENFVKKKMKNYRKANTESKIAIKKLLFNPVMKAFTSMKMNEKVYKRNSRN